MRLEEAGRGLASCQSPLAKRDLGLTSAVPGAASGAYAGTQHRHFHGLGALDLPRSRGLHPAIVGEGLQILLVISKVI